MEFFGLLTRSVFRTFAKTKEDQIDVQKGALPLMGNFYFDQLPVGLLAQLVEHCTGIAEVMGSNPVRA